MDSATVTVSLVVQIMKSETSRISHEQQAMKEKVKVNMPPAHTLTFVLLHDLFLPVL